MCVIGKLDRQRQSEDKQLTRNNGYAGEIHIHFCASNTKMSR